MFSRLQNEKNDNQRGHTIDKLLMSKAQKKLVKEIFIKLKSDSKTRLSDLKSDSRKHIARKRILSFIPQQQIDILSMNKEFRKAALSEEVHNARLNWLSEQGELEIKIQELFC